MLITEVDVNLLADGRVAVFHDDFLPNFVCLNTMTIGELRDVAGEVSTLPQVLKKAKLWARGQRRAGAIIVELKAPAPLCDPLDTSEADLVQAVIAAVRAEGLEDQVLFDSFSPALLGLAAQIAPEIARSLALGAGQFLTAAEIEFLTGLPVTVIDKDAGFGLEWAEIGPIFRLPGYASINQAIGVAFALGARSIDLDIQILGADPVAGAGLVALLHSFGFGTQVFTVNNAAEWAFVTSLGVQGVYTNDIPLGASLQAASQ